MFVIWGNVTLAGATNTPFAGSVSMTTLDGATILVNSTYSNVETIIVPLQSTLNLSQANVNEIVDIRCANSAAAFAMSTSLIAIPVDALSGSVTQSSG
jgi:hypothetical protein